MEEFKQALKNSDTIKVILTGIGEQTFQTKDIYKKILEYERLSDIGKAAEIAFRHGYFIYDIVYAQKMH